MESIHRDFSGHITDYLWIDATHINLNFRNLLNMLYKEVETFLNKPINFKKISRNQNRDCVFHVKLRSSILLNSRLLRISSITFLKIQLQFTGSSTNAFQDVIISLLFFPLFHGEYVIQQPFKNHCIAMNWNIDFVLVWNLL